MNELPFSTLLYRYFFFNWLFREVDEQANLFEKAAVVRHNRRQAHWLPVYMLRWLWCASLLYAAAGGIEIVVEAPVAARWCYAFSAMCISFAVTIATAWVGITQRREA